jgi:hypothetical protein
MFRSSVRHDEQKWYETFWLVNFSELTYSAVIESGASTLQLRVIGLCCMHLLFIFLVLRGGEENVKFMPFSALTLFYLESRTYCHYSITLSEHLSAARGTRAFGATRFQNGCCNHHPYHPFSSKWPTNHTICCSDGVHISSSNCYAEIILCHKVRCYVMLSLVRWAISFMFMATEKFLMEYGLATWFYVHIFSLNFIIQSTIYVR